MRPEIVQVKKAGEEQERNGDRGQHCGRASDPPISVSSKQINQIPTVLHQVLSLSLSFFGPAQTEKIQMVSNQNFF